MIRCLFSNESLVGGSHQQWLESAGGGSVQFVVSRWLSLNCHRQQHWLVSEGCWSQLNHFLLGQVGRKKQNQEVSPIYIHLLVGQGAQPHSGLTHSQTHTPLQYMCALCTGCIPASELQRELCTCSLLAQQPEQRGDSSATLLHEILLIVKFIGSAVWVLV